MTDKSQTTKQRWQASGMDADMLRRFRELMDESAMLADDQPMTALEWLDWADEVIDGEMQDD